MYSLPFFFLGGGEICVRIKQEITFKMFKNPYFLGGGGPRPNGGLRRPPYPRSMFFGLDGPMAHQVHFPDISLNANDITDFFNLLKFFPILTKMTLFFPISKALAPFPKYPETALISIGMFKSPKCDVNPQPNTRGIGPLVGRTSSNRRSVMHVLAVTNFKYNLSFLLYFSMTIYFYLGYMVW